MKKKRFLVIVAINPLTVGAGGTIFKPKWEAFTMSGVKYGL